MAYVQRLVSIGKNKKPVYFYFLEPHEIYIFYLPAGRSVLEKYLPVVSVVVLKYKFQSSKDVC